LVFLGVPGVLGKFRVPRILGYPKPNRGAGTLLLSVGGGTTQFNRSEVLNCYCYC